MVDYGSIEIENDGTAEKPSWSVRSEHCGHVFDTDDLNEVADYLRGLREDGHQFDGVSVELETA